MIQAHDHMLAFGRQVTILKYSYMPHKVLIDQLQMTVKLRKINWINPPLTLR